jgi:GNAT superfamily N-acetyltransferase
MADHRLRVVYMEQRSPPAQVEPRDPQARIAAERLARPDYLDLYRRVGAPWRWDLRLKMDAGALDRWLQDGSVQIYVLRDHGDAVGFCEFDASCFPVIELTHFGLVPEVQGRGLGPQLLRFSLIEAWRRQPSRIWLHTDAWDHPAAVRTYQRCGFSIFAVREEAADTL